MSTHAEIVAMIHGSGGFAALGGQPYCTIDVPGFQFMGGRRNTRERLRRFGVTEDSLKERTVLDLGCNIGGIALACQAMGAAYVWGYDDVPERISTAQAIADFCGMQNIKFIRADVLQDPVEQADVTFCLALDGWVDCDKLYSLLGRVTREVLYLESHIGMVPHTTTAKPYTLPIKARLERVGFTRCQVVDAEQHDEANARNQHYRPNIIAWK